MKQYCYNTANGGYNTANGGYNTANGGYNTALVAIISHH
jgi:hypothetical protein